MGGNETKQTKNYLILGIATDESASSNPYLSIQGIKF